MKSTFRDIDKNVAFEEKNLTKLRSLAISQEKTEFLSKAQIYKKRKKNDKAQNTVYAKFSVTKMLLTSSNFDQKQSF